MALKFLALGIWHPNRTRWDRPPRTGPTGICSSNKAAAASTATAGTRKSTTSSRPTRRSIFRYSHGSSPRPERRQLRQTRIQRSAAKSTRPTTSTASSATPPIISRRMFNEFRIGYNRRASSNPERPESAKDAITHSRRAARDLPLLQHRLRHCRRWATRARSARTGSSRTTSPTSPASTT